MTIKILREKYPSFIYQSYTYNFSNNDLEIFFDFIIKAKNGSNICFQPKVIIKNVDINTIKKIEKPFLDNLIFNLGLIEIPSYWKATCSPKIEIKAGKLNKEQINWWKDLFEKGMGQFFYENKINFKRPNFFEICNSSLANQQKFKIASPTSKNFKNRVLIPIGGGKDSIVTLELLKNSKKDVQCFSLNPNDVSLEIINKADCKNPIIVLRKIDKKILKLNQKGFLNGHTPFSAYLAFLSVLVGVIFDYKYLAFSNERSSNEGNLTYLGTNINHQWSKSFEFEQKFRNYCKKYLAKNIEYFSFLRPLYEIKIAELFSRYKKYFFTFLSCNEANKTHSGTKIPKRKWCCNCSKCLFVFTSLYPFLNEETLIKIFGENLFNKKSLFTIMQELIGEKKFKPFECVGTKQESLAIFYLSLKKHQINSKKGVNSLPILLKYFKENILPKYKNLEENSIKILNSWNNKHNLPKDFEIILKEAFRNSLKKNI